MIPSKELIGNDAIFDQSFLQVDYNYPQTYFFYIFFGDVLGSCLGGLLCTWGKMSGEVFGTCFRHVFDFVKFLVSFKEVV